MNTYEVTIPGTFPAGHRCGLGAWSVPWLGAVAFAAGLGAAGCTGTISEEQAPGSPSDTDPRVPPGQPPLPGSWMPPVASKCGSTALQRTTLRRLNRREYANTIRDLFPGIPSVVATALPVDMTSGLGLDTSGTDLKLPVQGADALSETAISVVKEVLAAGGAGHFTCAPGQGGLDRTACTRQILRGFLTKAFRRPAGDAEVEQHVALAGKSADFTQGVGLAIKAALLSPFFLFMVIDDSATAAGAPHRLGDFELASRLSYGLWSTMPDAILLDLAAKKQLQIPSVLAAQVSRMLRDDRLIAGMLGALPGVWLSYRSVETADKDTKKYPTFAGLRAAMKAETDRFISHVVRENLPVDELLTAGYSFVTKELAAHYGATAPPLAAGAFAKVDMKPDQRIGVMTHASFLAAHADDATNPITRGVAVSDSVACRKPPDPPGNADSLGSDPKQSTRSQLEQHRKDPVCANCHALFDPYGMALESYDAVGRFRAKDDRGFPVDPSGTMPISNKPFASAVEMSRMLAEETGIETCYALYVASYALGRTIGDEERCHVDEIIERRAKAKTLNAAEIVMDIFAGDLGMKNPADRRAP